MPQSLSSVAERVVADDFVAIVLLECHCFRRLALV